MYIYKNTTAITWYISMSYKFWTKVCRFRICFHLVPTNVIMKFWCIFKKTYVMSEKKIKQSKEPSRRYTKELFSSFSVWLMFMVACTVPIFCLSKTLGYCFISNFREWFEKCMNRKKEVAACYTWYMNMEKLFIIWHYKNDASTLDSWNTLSNIVTHIASYCFRSAYYEHGTQIFCHCSLFSSEF